MENEVNKSKQRKLIVGKEKDILISTIYNFHNLNITDVSMLK